MTTSGTPLPRRAGHRRFAPAAAAWAALLVLGGSAGCTNEDVPAATAGSTATTEEEGGRTAPEEVATRFLDAYTAYDADGAAAFLTGAGLDNFGGSAQALRLETEFRVATGYKHQFHPCRSEDGSPGGVTVRCPYDFHGIRSEEMGLGPYGDNYMDLTIADGRIVAVMDRIAFMTNGFSRQVWEPFAAWVSTEHPEDAAIMYTDGSRTLHRLSPESIELWERHSRGYVEEVAR